MKILWFTNTTTLASQKLGVKNNYGGWIDRLAEEIVNRNEIESFSIAFFHHESIQPFSDYGINFYPIHLKTNSSFINRAINKYNGIDNSEGKISSLLEIINSCNPDIIHIHGSELSFNQLINFTDIPIVLSFQGSLTVCSHFFYKGISESEVKKNSSLQNKIKLKSFTYSHKKIRNNAAREKKFLNKVKYIIGRTNWDKRISHVLAPEAQYFHCDELLRDEFLHYIWQSQKNQNIKIYSTSSSNLFKGLETIVESINLLKNKNFSISWNIGGLRIDDQVVKLNRRKYGNKFPYNEIKFLGMLTPTEIVNEMLNANMYVMASHIENSPNNLCEAMMIGMPIIASYAGGTSSLIDNNKEGFLIQDGDPWSLAGAILELSSNKELAKEFGEKARERAFERHNPQKVRNNIIEIYFAVLNRKKVKSAIPQTTTI